MTIIKITELEYHKLNLPVLFVDQLTDRVYGILKAGDKKFKLSWQSTDILPKVDIIHKSLCSLGIDLVFLILDFESGNILLKIPLEYFYYDTIIKGDFLYVITQLEIYIINTSKLLILSVCSLPDYFDSVEYFHEKVVVKCINDELVYL